MRAANVFVSAVTMCRNRVCFVIELLRARSRCLSLSVRLSGRIQDVYRLLGNIRFIPHFISAVKQYLVGFIQLWLPIYIYVYINSMHFQFASTNLIDANIEQTNENKHFVGIWTVHRALVLI